MTEPTDTPTHTHPPTDPSDPTWERLWHRVIDVTVLLAGLAVLGWSTYTENVAFGVLGAGLVTGAFVRWRIDRILTR